MMPTTESDTRLTGLPDTLRIAQSAIQLPEVQLMLRRLSEYGLGICMPHMHDERSGDFQLLPDAVVQVESGLEVSFQPLQDIAKKTFRFLPVAWIWRAGGVSPAAACEMVTEDAPSAIERNVKHKMATQ